MWSCFKVIDSVSGMRLYQLTNINTRKAQNISTHIKNCEKKNWIVDEECWKMRNNNPYKINTIKTDLICCFSLVCCQYVSDMLRILMKNCRNVDWFSKIICLNGSLDLTDDLCRLNFFTICIIKVHSLMAWLLLPPKKKLSKSPNLLCWSI